ncbi:MAG: hypothetical protein ABEJ73_12615 [Haloplanus sp.]
MTDLDDPALDVYADLTLDIGESRVSIRGYGDLVVVAAPTVAAARALARGSGIHPLVDRLRAAGVTLDLRVRGRSVARAGPEYDPGPLARALGVAPARLNPGGLLLTLLT